MSDWKSGFLSKHDPTSPPSARKEFSYEFFKEDLARDPIAQLGFDVNVGAMFPKPLTDKYHLPAGTMGEVGSGEEYRQSIRSVARVRPDLEGKLGIMYHPSVTSYDPAFKTVVLHEARHRAFKKHPEIFKDFNESIYGKYENFKSLGEEILVRFIDMQLFPESKKMHKDWIEETTKDIGYPHDSIYGNVPMTYERLEKDMPKLASAVIDASKKILEEKNKLLEPKEKTLIEKAKGFLEKGKTPDYEAFVGAMPWEFYKRMEK
jgi:hypothetical protein